MAIVSLRQRCRAPQTEVAAPFPQETQNQAYSWPGHEWSRCGGTHGGVKWAPLAHHAHEQAVSTVTALRMPKTRLAATVYLGTRGAQCRPFQTNPWGKRCCDLIGAPPTRIPDFYPSGGQLVIRRKRFLTAIKEINHLVRTVDQEVGGSSPPSCTNAKSIS